MGIIVEKEIGQGTYRNFERIRDAAGMTNYQVAMTAGIYQSQLSRWKQRSMTPKYPYLVRICDALRCAVSDIYAGTLEDGEPQDVEDG